MMTLPALFGFSVAGFLILLLAYRAIRDPGAKDDTRRMGPGEL
jgi:hypothetical protein